MTELSVSLRQKSPQSERDHGTMISEIVNGSQEKSSLDAAILHRLLCDSPPGGMIFLRRNINTLPRGFPSLSETFQLVRALRQALPDGESFTPSDWPVTGPLAGPLTVSWLEFRSVEGLHPTGIFSSNEKRIRSSAAVRKHIHFRDWPVYCRVSTTIATADAGGGYSSALLLTG
jgi:hypothetical protein